MAKIKPKWWQLDFKVRSDGKNGIFISFRIHWAYKVMLFFAIYFWYMPKAFFEKTSGRSELHDDCCDKKSPD